MLIRALRDGAWLTSERLRAYGLGYVLVALVAIAVAVPAIAGWDGTPPFDHDYLSFQAAAVMAWGGDAAGAWSRDLHAAAQTALQGQPGRYYAFFYPPPYLLILLPLGVLPLSLGFVAWVAATGAARR